MSTVDAKHKDFPVHFDELATEDHLVMRRATFEKLQAAEAELQAKLDKALADLEWDRGEKKALEAKLEHGK